jgi:hypothetical protein
MRSLVVAAGVSTVSSVTITASVMQLSQARRDLGGGSINGKFFFGGGCLDTGSPYTCDTPSSNVDIFSLWSSPPSHTVAALSEARGWPVVCSTGTEVVFAGGGTVQVGTHSTVADIFDGESGALVSYPNALSVGRWGVSCVSTGSQVWFAGGKVAGPQRQPWYTTDVIDMFNGTSWSVPPIKLSLGRESLGAVATSDGDIMFAGGWATGGTEPGASDAVDVFSTAGGGGAGLVGTARLKTPSYWPGAVSINGSAYVVSNENLHVIRGAEVVETVPLPVELRGESSMDGGGGIPAAHLPGNGVAVGGLACYYSITPNALYCYDTVNLLWRHGPATAVHKGGAMAVVGSTIMIAGGYSGTETTSEPTAVVDIFHITPTSPV